ncbi:uncharacterized protein LOC129586568 isoform X2 [Paramacrobiotus metropolitanus]|uniref:uncharacterized protein LOC129586568 isoform X2 n=1 Tax=Paramacrobiotus metropolitanus TaxID=2943436 RepID=UPI002445ECFD|nr:uncharacterized protein LOC129586568 isoform X2 [Paramacrobiotus metropolitanus]XP_055335852.1 uncharacterized protein LOC129586568 isoform X2 [Paramacrobiotus metropolitanus]
MFVTAAIIENSRQQCSPSLPTVLTGIGGDTPKQADGVWYVYRKMGGSYSSAAQIQITSVAPYFDPVTSEPVQLQWWEIFQDTAATSCIHQFWTGAYSTAGKQIGDLGGSDDSYIMRPTDYVVLYHNYQNLLISYGCAKSQADSVHCSTPTIIAQTRKRPDQLSASEMDNFDNLINSAFSAYCVTVQNIPKETYGPKGTCTSIDPPFCVAQDIQGMKNTIVNSSNSSATATTTSVPNYGYGSYGVAAPSGCKWPNSMPSQGKVDISLITGKFYLYRRLFAPEGMPVNQYAVWSDLGASATPLINATARTKWCEYVNYADVGSSQCVNGFFVGQIQETGFLSGLIIPTTRPGALQPFSTVFQYVDAYQQIFYGCGAQNLQTGICDAPVLVHLIAKNPLQLTQAEKDAYDAQENVYLSKYGCSAGKDVPLTLHSADLAPCPQVPPTDCMQNHITGYKQVLAGM